MVAAAAGLVAGLALVILGFSGLAELGGVSSAVGVRWSLWQIPPPGRSKAPGTPPNGWSRLGQLAVAVLLVILALEVVVAPFHPVEG
jgi:hypothetical protein